MGERLVEIRFICSQLPSQPYCMISYIFSFTFELISGIDFEFWRPVPKNPDVHYHFCPLPCCFSHPLCDHHCCHCSLLTLVVAQEIPNQVKKFTNRLVGTHKKIQREMCCALSIEGWAQMECL